jgi:hypothetical protein
MSYFYAFGGLTGIAKIPGASDHLSVVLDRITCMDFKCGKTFAATHRAAVRWRACGLHRR